MGLLSLGSPALAAGGLRLPALFADHMILQRATDAPIWGWADPGQPVAIDASWGAKVETKAAADGTWKAALHTPPAGGPFRITITSGGEKREISDVLSGEVWLCSGQSNMEMTVGPKFYGVENAAAEIAQADHPTIRIFDVANVVAAAPQRDCSGQWMVCTPQTAAKFSATAYFFAQELQRHVDVPIGLVESDWGGTPAEAWTRLDVVASFDEYKDAVAAVRKFAADPEGAKREQEAAFEAWYRRIDEKDPGVSAGWMNPPLDDQDWKALNVPGLWRGDLTEFDGVVWQRREVEIPPAWEHRALRLDLGLIDDYDTTWFNGVKIGQTAMEGAHTKTRGYEVPAELVKPGRATIAVRVVDIMGPGGFASESKAIRLHPTEGNESISLAGEWKFQRGAALSAFGLPPLSGVLGPNSPAALYNGMIAPLIPYAIRGAIWYQGESNRDHADVYRGLFGAMIEDWRGRWGRGDFPFYFVQIAPFRYGDRVGRAADIRQAQLETLGVPNTGMAVTLDIGNLDDIHPKNKRDVGRRLALWAAAKTYGKSNVVCSGPIFRSLEIEGVAARVNFDYADGLTSRGKPLDGFEIAGADGKFVAATARIERETVVVSSPQVTAPKFVRYAYSDTSSASLWNAAELPASPFRTDRD
ncbi:MAG: sialate O-acetylesterase [Phycisphaerae bacterium]